MKSLFTLLFALLLVTAGQSQISAHFTDTLNQKLVQLQTQLNLKGVSAAVVFSDSSVWKSAAGNFGSQQLVPQMHYEMGSNTKTMVSAIILQMEEEGLLSIDDSVGAHIGPFPNVDPGITLRQMLNMTSGIAEYINDSLVDILTNDINYFFDIDTVLQHFIDPPDFSPGTSWNYSNSNYLLLGKVIEAVDNQPFHTSLRNRMIHPAGLSHTLLSHYEPENLPRPAYWLTNGTYWDVDYPAFLTAAWSAGAIIAPPDDLASWVWQLHRGNSILTQASLDKLRDVEPLGGGLGYGLGMFQKVYNGRTYYGHGGTTLHHSEMDYSPTGDFGVVTVSIEQGTGADVGVIQKALIDILEAELPNIPPVGIGTVEAQNLAVTIAPNPATDYTTIRLADASATNIGLRVFNSSGQQMQLELNSITSGVLQLNKQDLGTGLFLVELTDSNTGARQVARIVFTD